MVYRIERRVTMAGVEVSVEYIMPSAEERATMEECCEDCTSQIHGDYIRVVDNHEIFTFCPLCERGGE